MGAYAADQQRLVPYSCVVLGQQGGRNEKPSLTKCLEGLRNSGNSSSSLAVFYVEQVALNRHVSPRLRLLSLSSKVQEMSSGKPKLFWLELIGGRRLLFGGLDFASAGF